MELQYTEKFIAEYEFIIRMIVLLELAYDVNFYDFVWMQIYAESHIWAHDVTNYSWRCHCQFETKNTYRIHLISCLHIMLQFLM